MAVGRSGLRRLGYGPVRDALLQARYVSAAGELVKAGGPTVKNVSGFDLCRLLVGSRGTLGFIGDVILRTRPRARFEQWFRGDGRSGRGVGAAVSPDGRAVGRRIGVGAAGRRPGGRRPADRAVGADRRRRAAGAAGRRALVDRRPAPTGRCAGGSSSSSASASCITRSRRPGVTSIRCSVISTTTSSSGSTRPGGSILASTCSMDDATHGAGGSGGAALATARATAPASRHERAVRVRRRRVAAGPSRRAGGGPVDGAGGAADGTRDPRAAAGA